MILCQWLILFHIFQCAIKKINIYDQKYPAESSFNNSMAHISKTGPTISFKYLFMGTSWVVLSIKNIKTRGSRQMTSRKNIKIFYFNGVNVAKHWHVAGWGICHLWLPCCYGYGFPGTINYSVSDVCLLWTIYYYVNNFIVALSYFSNIICAILGYSCDASRIGSWDHIHLTLSKT